VKEGKYKNPPLLFQTQEFIKHIQRLGMGSLQKLMKSIKTETSIERRIEKNLQTLEKYGFYLEHIEDIKEYLLDYSDMIELIPVIANIIKSNFPDNQVVFDIYKDPEIDDRYIVIYVRSKSYDELFMKKLEDVESEFLDYLVDKKGWIQLTTDFKKFE
jgi:hypothetical protein